MLVSQFKKLYINLMASGSTTSNSIKFSSKAPLICNKMGGPLPFAICIFLNFQLKPKNVTILLFLQQSQKIVESMKIFCNEWSMPVCSHALSFGCL